MVFNFLSFYNYSRILNKVLIASEITFFLNKVNFLNRFFLLNELIWQDGFLLDFLQKKSVDNWIRKFLIYTSYLFNERFVFDKVSRFYLDLLIWPSHFFSIFEFVSISNTIFIFIFNFILIIFILFLSYCFILIF